MKAKPLGYAMMDPFVPLMLVAGPPYHDAHLVSREMAQMDTSYGPYAMAELAVEIAPVRKHVAVP